MEHNSMVTDGKRMSGSLTERLLIGAAALALTGCAGEPSDRDAHTGRERSAAAQVPLVAFGDTLAICRLDQKQSLPSWARERPGEFFSATRTRDELSIIMAQSRVPQGTKCERDWRLLGVQGPLDFSLVGIIAGISGTLADARISIFALSTYDTDYILVKRDDFNRAISALRAAGYRVSE